jgi:hypothetical protein
MSATKLGAALRAGPTPRYGAPIQRKPAAPRPVQAPDRYSRTPTEPEVHIPTHLAHLAPDTARAILSVTRTRLGYLIEVVERIQASKCGFVFKVLPTAWQTKARGEAETLLRGQLFGTPVGHSRIELRGSPAARAVLVAAIRAHLATPEE